MAISQGPAGRPSTDPRGRSGQPYLPIKQQKRGILSQLATKVKGASAIAKANVSVRNEAATDPEADRHRRPHHPPSRLCGQLAPPQAHRGSVRLDQDHRDPAPNPPSRHGAGRLDVHPDRRRLQPDPVAEVHGRSLDMPGVRLQSAGSPETGRHGGQIPLRQPHPSLGGGERRRKVGFFRSLLGHCWRLCYGSNAQVRNDGTSARAASADP